MNSDVQFRRAPLAAILVYLLRFIVSQKYWKMSLGFVNATDVYICVSDCLYPWAFFNNTNVNSGRRVESANSVPECMRACINNAACTGFDFVASESAGQRCWLSGAWSGGRGQSTGTVHYDITRNCEGWDYLLSNLFRFSHIKCRIVWHWMMMMDWAVDTTDLWITDEFVVEKWDRSLMHRHDCRCHSWIRGLAIADDRSCVEHACLEVMAALKVKHLLLK